MTVVGLLHPGEMGAQVGRCLVSVGVPVMWASQGRSAQTVDRAESTGLRDVGSLDRLTETAEVIVSVCPPGAAIEVAQSVRGYTGVYVDANAVAPATVRGIAEYLPEARFVDGGLIGPPPQGPGSTRLYVAGTPSGRIADLFGDSDVEVVVVPGDVGAASAVKMGYAAWTKGTAALLLAIRAAARAEGVEATLLDEWGRSQPDLAVRSERAAKSAATKGWRWVAEMEQISATLDAADLPAGFHTAAAQIYARAPYAPDDPAVLEQVLGEIAHTATEAPPAGQD